MKKHIERLKRHYQQQQEKLKKIDQKIVAILHSAEIGLIVVAVLILSSTFAFNVINFSQDAKQEQAQ